MLRDLPRRMTGDVLQHFMDIAVGIGCADFVLLPWEGRKRNMGFAFVNYQDAATAERAMQKMQGWTMTFAGNSRTVKVMLARVQGFEANMEMAAESMTGRNQTDIVMPLVRMAGEDVEFREALARLRRRRMAALAPPDAPLGSVAQAPAVAWNVTQRQHDAARVQIQPQAVQMPDELMYGPPSGWPAGRPSIDVRFVAQPQIPESSTSPSDPSLAGWSGPQDFAAVLQSAGYRKTQADVRALVARLVERLSHGAGPAAVHSL